MTMMVPPAKPRMTASQLMPKLRALGIEPVQHPLIVAGIRGYYRDTMGRPGLNDRGLYDDAIFLIGPEHFSSYNANTDPSRRRPGSGFGASKGMARLLPGVWHAYRFARHQGARGGGYEAICQRAAPVRVMRDGNPDYLDEGMFGINIHRGGRATTSSEGCQTIHPGQWDAFIASAQDQARRSFGAGWRGVTLSYALMEGI